MTVTKFLAAPGRAAIVLLAVITAAEYVVSAADVPVLMLFLTVFLLMKAVTIVLMFMQLRNVFGRETP